MVLPLIAGNWKMNGLSAESGRRVLELRVRFAERGYSHVELAVFPPYPLLPLIGRALEGSEIALGAQDCHAKKSGAHTGDVSAELLADIGCRYVIVGHSERRQDHGETDAQVKAKAEAALAAGLTPVVCLGETEAERDGGRTLEVVERQLAGSLPGKVEPDRLVVAYEPVWAIGTGRTPTVEEVAEVHAHLRRLLEARFGPLRGAAGAVRLLYGGSVKPANAAELLAVEEVDGALVGGASLDPKDFLAIAGAAPQDR